MQYTLTYKAPIGSLLLAGDETGLTGLWMKGGKYFADTLGAEYKEMETPILKDAKRWLDIYFSGREPEFMPPLHLSGSPFRMMVWDILKRIPYGNTMTYGEISFLAAEKMGKSRMSAQAVGNAVGHNPVSILVPCHRVIGAGGSLMGYAGGVDKKAALLMLEGVEFKDEEHVDIKKYQWEC